MAGFFNLDELANVPRQEIRKKTITAANCDTCGLYKKCLSPRIEPVGDGKLGILIVGEIPGKNEDRYGKPGESGLFLKQVVRELDCNLERDFIKMHAVACRPPKGADPTPLQVSACRKWLLATVEKHKPKVILAFGKYAMDGLIGHRVTGRMGDNPPGISDWSGCTIPDQELGCWVLPTWHPSHIIYSNEDPVLVSQFKSQIKNAIEYAKKPFPVCNWESRCRRIKTVKEANDILDMIYEEKRGCAFDYETTGKKPYREGQMIYTASISDGELSWAFPFFDDNSFRKRWKWILTADDIEKDTQNGKFEALWTWVKLGYWPVFHWDTMLGGHSKHNRRPTNLKFQAYTEFGVLGYDADADPYLETLPQEKERYGANGFNNIKKAPLDMILLYNGADSLFTKWLGNKQKKGLRRNQREGTLFFVDAARKFAKIESTGINMAVNKFITTENEMTAKLNRIEKRVLSLPELKLWDKPRPFRLSATGDLSHLLFDLMKYEAKVFTDGGKTGKIKPKSDKYTLEKIDELVVKKVLEWRKWEKARGTYLTGFTRETIDGIMHPFFNFDIVRTFRSSSSDPNFQNIPKRQKDVMRMLRSLLIAFPGELLGEYDYKAVEVAVGACYHKDPNMIKYIEDESSDMHRDAAIDLFFRDLAYFKDEATKAQAKEERQIAKNAFVFPEFYGSYFEQTAPDIWDDISEVTKEHLRDNGVRDLYDFTEHVEEVERILWEDRFPVYAQWKKDYYKEYLKKGYVDLYTGFRCYGPMKKNEVVNYPIQGSAFHCLLWGVLHVIDNMERERLESRYIGQIHDSGIASIVPKEEAILDHMIWYWGTQKIREHWDWIIVPLTIEKARSAVDGNFAEMVEVGKLKFVS
jgi:uracil-DNA glycosylase family 4